MKHLIFSDIHGNFEALSAVIDHTSGREFDSIICLGDFVGYGASPNECVHTVAALSNVSAVLGNHDEAVIDPVERNFFNPVAQAGIVFSRRNIDGESRAYLENLPLVIDSGGDFIAVHASPYDPAGWVYILDPLEATDAFHAMKHTVAFVGHTHMPAVHLDNGTSVPFVPGTPAKLQPGKKCIINVGSVGQPRDGDCRAAFVIYDDADKMAEIFRIDYDIDRAAAKILDAGLPPILAERIRLGY